MDEQFKELNRQIRLGWERGHEYGFSKGLIIGLVCGLVGMTLLGIFLK